jgi:hypothetical protein
MIESPTADTGPGTGSTDPEVVDVAGVVDDGGPKMDEAGVPALVDPADPAGFPDRARTANGDPAEDGLDRWPTATASSARRRTTRPRAMIRSTRLMSSIHSSLS